MIEKTKLKVKKISHRKFNSLLSMLLFIYFEVILVYYSDRVLVQLF